MEDAPATNNSIENYYSASLKTHRKKQLRAERGIKNQMKRSAMKRGYWVQWHYLKEIIQ